MGGTADLFLLTYGVELASSWLNMMLYMLEIVMCMRYFQRARRPLPHRIGVGLMLLFDTLCTMSLNANVFLTFLGFFGRATFMSLSDTTTVSLLMTYSTAAVEQLFLCHLYYVLSRNRLVSLVLVLIGLVHLSFSYAAGIMVQVVPSEVVLTFKITAAGAIICGANDLLIAGFLGYEFFKIKKSSGPRRGLVRRIFILSLASGAIVASTTLLMMILLLKGDVAFDFFFSCQGRVYALTLLVNFLSGPSLSPSCSNVGASGKSGLNGAGIDGNSTMYCPDPYPLGSEHGYGDEKGLDHKRAPSLRSNLSAESLNKELPALPISPPPGFPLPLYSAAPANSTSPRLPRLSFAPSHSHSYTYSYYPYRDSSFTTSSTIPPALPLSPRTIIAAPHRVESLRSPTGAGDV